ncbi:MAG: hypothetical protein P8N94_02555 [Gammaproteobacteria bacterium]|nr:hypothetical protein [Gammaproteobacteria bacterium]
MSEKKFKLFGFGKLPQCEAWSPDEEKRFRETMLGTAMDWASGISRSVYCMEKILDFLTQDGGFDTRAEAREHVHAYSLLLEAKYGVSPLFVESNVDEILPIKYDA